MGELKARRNYTLLVENQNHDGFITINPPFTLEFDVTRNILSSANTATIRIYNLNENTRSQLYKDIYDTLNIRSIELKAGYGPPTVEQQKILDAQGIKLGTAYAGASITSLQLPTIFKGNIGQASSVREGVNFVTTIEAYDGGYAFMNGEVNRTTQAGASNNEILKDIQNSLPGVAFGAISDYGGKKVRPVVLSGSAADIANEISNGGLFIDNGKFYCLKDEDCIRGILKFIDSNSGLLGTPVREKTIIKFDMIFEPRFLISQLVTLNSDTAKNFNGFYKIVSIKHHGTISEAVCGDAITNVGLWKGPGILKEIN